MSPWLEFRVLRKEKVLQQLEAQKHRRFLKTHCCVEEVGLKPNVKYLYIARDARDAIWSLHHQYRNVADEYIFAVNSVPDRVGPPLDRPCEDVYEYYTTWLRGQ